MINSLKFGSNTHTFSLPYGEGVVTTSNNVNTITVTADNFSLETGARILVKFKSHCDFNVATITSVKLNVNNTGAKTIKCHDDTTLGQCFKEGKIYEFVYDGTNYEAIVTPWGWDELSGNRPNIQCARCNAGGEYKGWVRIIKWDRISASSGITDCNGQVFTLMLAKRYHSSPAETHMFNICIPSGTIDQGETTMIVQTMGATSSDYNNSTAHLLRKLRIVLCSDNNYYLEYYVPPEEPVVANGTNSVLVRVDGTHGEAFQGKIIVGGELETEANPQVLKSIDIARNIRPETSTVLYEADPKNFGGIYCNGKTAADSNNSVTLSDPNKVYKRLKLFAHAPYGMMSVDFDLSGEPQSVVTGNNVNEMFGTNRHGSLMGFGADHDTGNPANKHIMYQINFTVTEVTAGWRIQVIESGWLSFGIPALSATDYSGNITGKKSGTEYPHWNQRHNNNYLIYKIIGYTD